MSERFKVVCIPCKALYKCSVAGPTVCNSLPESVRSAETLANFKHKLKTYLFNISF